jgi:hypothetical protein
MIETLQNLCRLCGLDRFYTTLFKRRLSLRFFLDFGGVGRWRAALARRAKGGFAAIWPRAARWQGRVAWNGAAAASAARSATGRAPIRSGW